jgi:hypothetical protein
LGERQEDDLHGQRWRRLYPKVPLHYTGSTMTGNLKRSKIQYYVLCVEAFANAKQIPPKDAFTYLYTNKGIEFLIECYDAEHTLSLDDAVEDLTMVCRNHGGNLE